MSIHHWRRNIEARDLKSKSSTIYFGTPCVLDYFLYVLLTTWIRGSLNLARETIMKFAKTREIYERCKSSEIVSKNLLWWETNYYTVAMTLQRLLCECLSEGQKYCPSAKIVLFGLARANTYVCAQARNDMSQFLPYVGGAPDILAVGHNRNAAKLTVLPTGISSAKQAYVTEEQVSQRY